MRRKDGLRSAATGTELCCTREGGAVGSGLYQAALITEIAKVYGHAGGAEKNDEAEGGEDEAVARFVAAFFGPGEISHCDNSNKIPSRFKRADARAGERARTLCGEESGALAFG